MINIDSILIFYVKFRVISVNMKQLQFIAPAVVQLIANFCVVWMKHYVIATIKDDASASYRCQQK